MPTHDDVLSWHGRHLVGPDGRAIGRIDGLYADDETGRPTWATVHTGLFGRRTSFVPITDAQADGDDVRVPFDKDRVKDAPSIDPDGRLTADEEAELFRHYGVTGSRSGTPDRRDDAPGEGRGGAPGRRAAEDDWARRPSRDAEARDAARGRPDASGGRPRSADAERHGSAVSHADAAPHTDAERHADGSGPESADGAGIGRRDASADPRPADHDHDHARRADDGMTLSEEQVRVRTQELPATKVRMRKVTVTENVQMTVPVTREEVRLEEVPVDAPDDPDVVRGGETTLRSEVPVVEKATVDTERVRLGTERVDEQVEITEPVRREAVDVERTGPDGR